MENQEHQVEEKHQENQVEEKHQENQVEEESKDNLMELKKKFYLGLQQDDSESARLYLEHQFISNQKLLTYCLVENLENTWNVFFEEFPQLVKTINGQDDHLAYKLFLLGIKYQRYTMMTKMYNVLEWNHQQLNWKNKHTKTIFEYTFLNMALYYQHLPTIEFLLRNGADPLVSYPENGNTSYYLAVMIGNTSVMETLLQYITDLNVVNFKKNTPLHLASELGNLDIVTILVEYGSDVNKRNYDTNTPLDLAELEGHTSIVEYLRTFKVESHYQEAYYF